MVTISIAVCDPSLQSIAKLFRSLKKTGKGILQVIVFNNTPEVKEVESSLTDLVKKYLPLAACKVLHDNGNNVGFGDAHNRNLSFATQPYFIVLNDDIEFYAPWVSKLISPLEKDLNIKQVSISQGQCNTVDIHGNGYFSEGEPMYCEGSCFAMRTKDAKDFNLFDSETYIKGYYEDSDLSFRIKKAGFSITSVLVNWKHFRAVSSQEIPNIQAYHELNRQEFLKKWYGYIVSRKFGPVIAVKRTGALGDVFLATPILEALRGKYKDSTILLLTEAKDVVQHPIADLIVPIGFPCYFDEFIDLDYSYEKDFSKHIIDAYAETANVTVTSYRGIPQVSSVALARLASTAMPPKSLFNKKLAFLDLSDTWEAKQWPQEKYKELSILLRKDGYNIVGVGKTRKPISLDLDWSFINILSVQEAMCSLVFADLYVGHDGFLAHVAQSTDTPSVVLYTICKPELISDISSKYLKPVVSKIPCQGCRHKVQGYTITCQNKYKCTDIPVNEVYAACRELA